MSSVTRLATLVFLLCLTVADLVYAQDQHSFLRATQQSSLEEVGLRTSVVRYFDALAMRDLTDLMKYWSVAAPDLEIRKKELQAKFAANDHVEVKNLTIRILSIDGDQARLHVDLEITALDIKTRQPSTGFGKMVRAMHWLKESGFWRINSETSVEEELAAELVAARTDQEREALLLQNHEFVNSPLITAVKVFADRSTDYREQLRIYALGQNLAERMGDKRRTAELLNNVSAMHRMLADYPTAIVYARKGLAISEDIGDQAGVANSLLGLGVFNFSLGNYTEALEYYQRSLSISESLGDKKLIAFAFSGIAQTAEVRGDYAKALDAYNQSLALREQLGDQAKIGLGLNAIGVVYFRQGNYAQALEYALKSLAVNEESKNTQGIAQSLSTAASVYREQGNYAQALTYFQRSLKIRENLGEKRGIGNQLNNIGLVYQLLGDGVQALEYFDKALSLREAIGDKHGIALSLNSIAHVHLDSRDYAGALGYAQRAAMLARETGEGEVLWNAQTVVGRCYRLLNKFELAKDALTEAIATIESLRFQVAGGERDQEQFFESKVAPYREMTELFVTQTDTNQALNYAERAKARVLLDVLRTGRTNISKSMSADEQRREQELRTVLTSLNTQIAREKSRQQSGIARLQQLEMSLAKARLEHEDFEASLYVAHPELKIQRGETATFTIEQAGDLMDDRNALLEYTVTDAQVFLFVLTRLVGTRRVEAKTYKLSVGPNELIKLVGKFRQRLGNRDLDYSDSATELYGALLKPAVEQLKGKNSLVIVPDDFLWDLAFQALQSSNKHYLVEDYAISYAPSLTVLREMIAKHQRPHKQNQSTLLAIGNPSLGKQTIERARMVMVNEGLEPLPEGERQVRTLGQLYGLQRSKIYVGPEAREDRFKAEAAGYRILQMATHSVLNDANPMYSHVVLSQLAGDSKEDGLLEAWEIMGLDLKADLVVLSACDTARGRIGAGEGVIGLTWAFFVAGSPATIVSKWSVESVSTTELMLNFHRHLKSGVSGAHKPITKAEALRQAQLMLLRTKRYEHPFFWAAFVVVGDGS